MNMIVRARGRVKIKKKLLKRSKDNKSLKIRRDMKTFATI